MCGEGGEGRGGDAELAQSPKVLRSNLTPSGGSRGGGGRHGTIFFLQGKATRERESVTGRVLRFFPCQVQSRCAVAVAAALLKLPAADCQLPRLPNMIEAFGCPGWNRVARERRKDFFI